MQRVGVLFHCYVLKFGRCLVLNKSFNTPPSHAALKGNLKIRGKKSNKTERKHLLFHFLHQTNVSVTSCAVFCALIPTTKCVNIRKF